MRDPVGEVPSGYAVHRVADAWLVLRSERAAELIPLRLAHADSRRTLFESGPNRGRGRAPSVALGAASRVVLRRYRHGGLLAPLTRSLIWGPERAISELRVCIAAERAGAPVPQVLCVAAWPRVGPFWSALIGTEEVTGALDLEQWTRGSRSSSERVSLARRVGVAVRRLHDAGIEHRDLQLRNILVRSVSEEVVVIDLDRAHFHGPAGVPMARRAQNLGRLVRSALKRGLWQARIGRRERAAFLSGYLEGDRKLREALRSRVCRERLKLAAHRVSWPLRAALSSPKEAAPPRPA